MGWEKEGERKADRLQQSTDALFHEHRTLGVQVSAALLTWATYFQVSAVTDNCSSTHACEGIGREGQRGRGSGEKLTLDTSYE